MLYSILKTLHVLSIIVWVGGMVFAHFFLRPAVAFLEPPARVRLMHAVLGRFFQAVLVACVLTLLSGGWMLSQMGVAPSPATATPPLPWAWTVMAVLGTAMVAIFLYIRFFLFPTLTRAVAASEWPSGGAALARIRTWVSVNLVISAVVLLVTLIRW
jgi:uncharacterized membrane protein